MYSGSGKYPTEQLSRSVYSLPHECQKCVHCPIHSCELNLCLRTARQGQQHQRMDWVFCITAPFPFLRMKDRSLDSGFVTGLSSSIVPITPSNEIVFASTRQQGPDIKTKRGPTTNRWPSSIHALYDVTLRLMPCPALPSNMTDVIIYFNDTRIWWMCGILHDD